MPRKSRQSKKSKAVESSTAENAEAMAPPSPPPAPMEVEPAVVPDGANGQEIDCTAETQEVREIPVDTGANTDMILSEEERKLIEQLRSNDKDAQSRILRQTAVERANEAPSVEEEAYADLLPSNNDEAAYAEIFSPTATLNSVHAHCMGLIRLRPLELRKAVEEALQKAKSWKEDELEVVFHSLAEALPKLAETLIGKKGLPVPVSFSPQRIKQAYE